MDRRTNVRVDQPQPSPGSRLRALRNDRCGIHPPRHDPHHAQATCCKRLVMNPNFPDGLLDKAVARCALHGANEPLETGNKILTYAADEKVLIAGALGLMVLS